MTKPSRPRTAPPAKYCGIPSPVHAAHPYRGLYDGRVRRLLCPGARWGAHDPKES